MLCPVCATEMNGSQKCPFCGHVCVPGEDNKVILNGKVISKGHHNNWCRSTDNQRLAGKVVDGTHYHSQNPYAANQSAAGQYVSNQYTPNQYAPNNQGGLNGQMSEDELRGLKMVKKVKIAVIIFLVLWAAPFVFAIIMWIFMAIFGR